MRSREKDRETTQDGYAGTGVELIHHTVCPLPPGEDKVIDHRNRIKLDNRRSNLRVATRATNSRNRTTSSTTGFLGVTINGSRYTATIFDTTVSPVEVLQRHFSTAIAASAWRVATCRRIFPEDYE